MRFFARILSFVTLVAGIVVATLDAIRFVATAVVDPLPVRAVLAWAGAEPSGRAVLEHILVQPAAAVLLALSLVFWMAGYRRPRPFMPFAGDGANSIWR